MTAGSVVKGRRVTLLEQTLRLWPGVLAKHMHRMQDLESHRTLPSM